MNQVQTLTSQVRPVILKRASVLLLLLSTVLAASASAQTLTGTVKNSTTGKPGAGDDVVLITLGQGMEEAGRTKADAKGNFSFKLDQRGPHLVRVIHQDVTYHRMAPPGTTSVEVEVYDVSKKVEGIEVVADIMRFQAGNGNMQIERTFAVQNNSKPPRTQMNEHNLEFYVPEGAKITEGEAMTANGQPLKSDCLHDALHRKRERGSQERLSARAFRRDRAKVDAVCARQAGHIQTRAISGPAGCERPSRFKHPARTVASIQDHRRRRTRTARRQRMRRRRW